jgi:hypothetical protein
MKTTRLFCLLPTLMLLPVLAQAQDGGPADLATPDGSVSCGQVIGKPCTPAGGECGPQAACVLVTQTQGICTCPCTGDDPTTHLIVEDSCPDPGKHVCAKVQPVSGPAQHVCLKLCKPKLGANDCTAPFACHPKSVVFSWSANQASCWHLGCKTGADCPVLTGKSCDTSNPVACSTGEQCEPFNSSTSKGICAGPGTCDMASGLCGKHPTTRPNAKVGDPCKADTECGEFMQCWLEVDPKALGLKDHGQPCTSGSYDCCGTCLGNVCSGICTTIARNGYCTITNCVFATKMAFSEFLCPTGTECHKRYLGGICMKSCRLGVASDCRGHSADKLGDYECWAWNNVYGSRNAPFTNGPVCDLGF